MSFIIFSYVKLIPLLLQTTVLHKVFLVSVYTKYGNKYRCMNMHMSSIGKCLNKWLLYTEMIYLNIYSIFVLFCFGKQLSTVSWILEFKSNFGRKLNIYYDSFCMCCLMSCKIYVLNVYFQSAVQKLFTISLNTSLRTIWYVSENEVNIGRR